MLNPPICDCLVKIFENSLPGRAAQLPLAPLGRVMDIPSGARKATVLILVIEATQEIVFIRRSVSANDKHSGQISFPGGKVELDDYTLEDAVLRETNEELGITTSSVRLFGQLTSLYIPVSGFLVYPFIGSLPDKPSFYKQDDEVAEVLLFPLSSIMHASIQKDVPVRIGNTMDAVVPAYVVNNQTIWGATAMMLAEFIAAYKTSIKELQ